jgi:hypothetical protein
MTMFGRVSSIVATASFCAAFVAAGSANAQSVAPRFTAQDADTAFEQLRAETPGLRAEWNFSTGFPDFVYARAIRTFGVPRTDAEFEATARRVVDTFPGLFGFDSSVLVTKQVKHVELESIGSTDKTVVEFEQWVGGVPVDHGTVGVLFGHDGGIVSLENNALPNVASIDVVPTVSEQSATQVASDAFGKRAVVRAIELAVVPDAKGAAGVLAWLVDLRGPADPATGIPAQEKFQVDAHRGTVIRHASTICNFTDLIGHLNQWASPGTLPDEPSNPLSKFTNAYYVHVKANVGKADSDRNGDWTIKYSGSSQQTVNFGFGSGNLYAYVVNQAGSGYTLSATATPGVLLTNGLNKSGTEQTTSQNNAQRVANVFRLYIKDLDPTDTTFDFQQKLNVNINATCNAYYDGVSTNFYLSGGGCPNTAYSTVVSHETGHWANDKYGSGNGADGFGEGAADTWAMYQWDTQLVGEDFFGVGTYIRTGDNTRQYCGSCGAGCYGEVHADGEVLMGALWKVRANLNTDLGDAAGDAVADKLLLGWFQVYNANQICTKNERQWLTLDDDDGNIDNGTPHSTDINNAFVTQGFPSYY